MKQKDQLDLTKSLLEQAKNSAFSYLENTNDLPVFPGTDALALLDDLSKPFHTESIDPSVTLSELSQIGDKTIVNHSGSRYFGFVNGGVLPIGIAARWIADTWDQNAALEVMSPLAAKLEEVCESWLVDLFNLPGKTKMGLVGGTSVATLCGIAAARHYLLSKLGWDINADGLMNAPRLRIIMGDQTHGTVPKMVKLLGFGSNSIEIVPSDKQGRMLVNKIPTLDDHCIVILQAGNVCTGSYDDFSSICELANNAQAWIHIDGAFGLWALASEKFTNLTKGIQLADSWSADGHKTLNTPYDCGAIFCKHPTSLVEALHQQGSYISAGDNRDSMSFTPDMSRRARGIDLWACLHHLGKKGIQQLVDRLHFGAIFMKEGLSSIGFHIENDVHFNQVIVRAESDAKTKHILHELQKNGVVWCGSAMWKGHFVIRISICSWQTNDNDLTIALKEFERAFNS